MNYWLFISTRRKVEGKWLEAWDILNTRLADGFWGLGETTPNRRELKKGDRIIFYVGQPQMVFAVTATLASNSWELSDQERNRYSHGQDFFTTQYGVQLENICRLQPPCKVVDLIENLEFIRNKNMWYSAFQGGVKSISERDFNIIESKSPANIIEATRATEIPQTDSDDVMVSETLSQFALEAHLEDFIDRNWDRIDFGARLEKYEDKENELSGRQFPAGKWKIDFLCVDKSNSEFVVIELKRGKTSDATVGQAMRYVGWVSENLANGRKVRAIIITQDSDEGLKYAVKAAPNVSVLTYRVDFKLFPQQG